MPASAFTIPDMSCQHCVNAITSAVTGVPGVTAVAVDLEAGTVAITGETLDDVAIRAAIDEAGYEVAS